jgi:hypothetical protein
MTRRRLTLAVLSLAAAVLAACSNPTAPSAPTKASLDGKPCSVTNGSSIC